MRAKIAGIHPGGSEMALSSLFVESEPMSIEALATFFGLCSVINIGLILLLLLLTAVSNKEDFPFDVISKIFGITKEDVKATHFRVFQQFRVAVLMLNIVPYIALQIMAH